MSMSKAIPNKVYLTEDELPKQYYNIAADMPNKPRITSYNVCYTKLLR